MASFSQLATLALVVARVSAEVPGCFVKSYGDASTDYVTNAAGVEMELNGDEAQNCQTHCDAVEGAGSFELKGNLCFCKKGYGTLEWKGDSVVSGPLKCPKKPAVCSSKLVDDIRVGAANAPWPKVTADDGMKAWSSGYQPQKLQCWPHKHGLTTDGAGEPYACAEEVKDVNEAVNLEDWSGNCSGLTKTEITEKECEKNCNDNYKCSGFVVEKGTNACWQSFDVDCLSTGRPEGFQAKVSKRIQRGSIRVIETLTQVKVAGLTQMFTYDDEMKFTKSAIENCKHICYSLIHCSMWQLSATEGCFVEHSGKSVQYPLTRTAEGLTDGPEAATFEAGEYIQRTCSHQPKAEEKKPFYKQLWFLIAAPLALCALCLGVFLCLRACGKSKKKPKSTRSRGLKPQPQARAPDTQPLMQMVQVPVYQQVQVSPRPMQQVIVQQPQIVYETPQVVYEAPRAEEALITRQEFLQMAAMSGGQTYAAPAAGTYAPIMQEPTAMMQVPQQYATPQQMTYIP